MSKQQLETPGLEGGDLISCQIILSLTSKGASNLKLVMRREGAEMQITRFDAATEKTTADPVIKLSLQTMQRLRTLLDTAIKASKV